MDTIGDRIRWLRNQRGLTLVKFGSRIGITNPSLSAIETGKSNPSKQTIMMICQNFGVSEVWLREGVGEPFASKARADEMAEFIKGLMSDSPDSFRSRLVTALLRFDPNGAEWEVLERIYESVAAEQKKEGRP